MTKLKIRTMTKLKIMLATISIGLVGALALVPAVSLAAGDANQASCPNEALSGFSSSLPDCRAYEQVTPTFKAGFGVGFNFAVEPPAGEEATLRVAADSLGATNGGSSPPGATGTFYDLSRGGAGWSTMPLSVSLAEYAYGDPTADATLGDSGSSLQTLHLLDESIYQSNIYIRRPKGELEEVGPTLAKSVLPPTPTGSISPAGQTLYAGELVGATPNFDHIVFQLDARFPNELPVGITSELWPGDTTVSRNPLSSSLYEYAGVGNSEPVLVGVKNEGVLHGSPHINEGAELVSQCGTVLGSAIGGGITPTENRHNAVSGDGSSVVFTAVGADEHVCSGSEPAVDEVFARIDGARTVAISEPVGQTGCSETSCLENTGAGHEANYRDANFEGASADGSKVFFTSTQQLLNGATQDPSTEDSATRGGESERCLKAAGVNGCNLYEYDFDAPAGHNLVDLSMPEGLVGEPLVQGVAAVSEDGSRVYFVAKGVLAKDRSATGEAAEPGEDNLYVADTVTHTTSFVARLSPQDDAHRYEQWSSTADNDMNVTSNGRFLVFTSVRDLTPDDTSSTPQVFRYDAETGVMTRISVGDRGFNSDGNTTSIPAYITPAQFGGNAGFKAANIDLHPAISEDGGSVVFASAARLTPDAPESVCTYEEAGQCFEYASVKIYEYHEGRVFLISGSSPSSVIQISPSGRDIMFQTKDSLVPSDTDSQEDIYDARVEGGFPVHTSAPPCEGGACQGAPTPQPVFGTPASAIFSAPGALTLPPVPAVKQKPKAKPLKCKRGFVKRRGRCVKKPAAKRRARKSNGRTGR